jgi:hypothetical protein
MQFVKDFEGDMFEGVREKPLVFTDESKFSTTPDNGWVWKRRGVYSWSILSRKEKFPHISIMVWGAVAIGWKSKLLIFDGKVDADKYFESLSAGFFPEADAHFGAGQWVLVQDGAPCHTAASTIEKLGEKCIICPSWPANSPDLNPIEMIWGIIKNHLNWAKITNKQQAIDTIRKVWNEIPQETIDRLCRSFLGRVKMVVAVQGQTIQPLLSANKTTVPPDYLAHRPEMPPLPATWTAEEDELFVDIRIQHPKLSWDMLTKFFPGRTAANLRNRWNKLRVMALNKKWNRPTI